MLKKGALLMKLSVAGLIITFVYVGTPLVIEISHSKEEPTASAIVAESGDQTDKYAPADVVTYIGNSQRGQQQFRQCSICHPVKRNGRNSLGPNLYGVVDRAVASQDGYNYSAAMQSLGGVWSTDRLDAYLEAPLSYVPGTSMTRATPDGQDRADIIAYLASLQVDE